MVKRDRMTGKQDYIIIMIPQPMPTKRMMATNTITMLLIEDFIVVWFLRFLGLIAL